MTVLKTTAEGIKLIHSFEECRLQAYKCPADKWTIGWGNTYYEDGSPVRPGQVITQERADELFANILPGFEAMARKAITAPITGNQFSAFVSALYNVGPGRPGVKGGLIKLEDGRPSTLLKRINANPNDPTIRNAFLMWVSPGTEFTNGLRRRRKEEAALYFKA